MPNNSYVFNKGQGYEKAPFLCHPELVEVLLRDFGAKPSRLRRRDLAQV